MGTAPTARTLLVLRHAKAAPGEAGGRDADRPLTARGRRDAAAAGRRLLASGLLPDLVRCSDAVRTRQTWQHVAAALAASGRPPQASFEGRIYAADDAELLRLLWETPDDAGTVLLIGHNPAAGQLAAGLTGQSGLGFPTAALAVVRFAGGWPDLARGGTELAALWSPGGRA